MTQVADAIRKVTAVMQRRFDDGERSAAIDLHDLIEVLLTIADELDPPLAGSPVDESDGCPNCGERRSNELIWQDDEVVRCTTCGASYRPGEADRGCEYCRAECNRPDGPFTCPYCHAVWKSGNDTQD